MHKETILKFFPKIEISDYEIITKGWESDIVIINKDLVFRFPKDNNRFDCVYNKEKIITDKIKPYIKTNIPTINIYDRNPKFFSFLKKKKEDYSNTFCVLRYIPSLDYENYFEGKTETEKENIVDDLTGFIKEMHSIPFEIFKKPLKNNLLYARNLPFEYKLEINNFNINYDVLSPILKKYNLEDDFNNSIQIFSNFDWKNEDNVICHNDLHRGNIMIDNGKMSGIIDFGDCIYTNYNVEFISIFKWQEIIVNKIVKKYEEITGKKLNIKFILSVIKLGIYAKITNKINDLDKYLKRIEYYNSLINIYY